MCSKLSKERETDSNTFFKTEFFKCETFRLNEFTVRGLLTSLMASFRVTSSEEKENGRLVHQRLDSFKYQENEEWRATALSWEVNKEGCLSSLSPYPPSPPSLANFSSFSCWSCDYTYKAVAWRDSNCFPAFLLRSPSFNISMSFFLPHLAL